MEQIVVDGGKKAAVGNVVNDSIFSFLSCRRFCCFCFPRCVVVAVVVDHLVSS
jgi:hypothetical protein